MIHQMNTRQRNLLRSGESGKFPLTYGAMSSAGLETTKLSNYDEVNK